MAGSGKTTIGRLLAKALGWAFADSDHIIEAAYAAPLQQISDALGKEAFIEMEAEIIGGLRLCRTVLATGGSVVYRESAMRHLRGMGPIVYLDVPMNIVLERIARNPDRGLAIAPGQTVEDLFLEREALYRRYATVSVRLTELSPAECVQITLDALAQSMGKCAV
ncbi:MAG: shikimate kinase [Mailhella sp.]|nr:shikimate kinase [Mailhella sp.]